MYDLVIIGSGPAGLSAAVYAKRACLDLVVLEKEPMGGGQIIYTEQVDNYLGLPGKNGFDLAQEFEKHAKELGVSFREGDVQEVKKSEGGWQIFLKSGENIETKTVLLATGATHRKLGVPGENALAGAGVSYCATCDGAFFRDKTVAVVGGGDVALEDALYLAKTCKQVWLIHRRQGLRAVQLLQEQVKSTDNITFVPDSVIAEIRGANKVEQLLLRNVQDQTETTLALDGVFIAVGMDPQTEAVASVLSLDGGYVPAGEDGITEAPGLFVAGDVRTKRLRQIVTAVSDGANAVTSIVDFLHSTHS
jgi:thioredoxin reductase (NADPH)